METLENSPDFRMIIQIQKWIDHSKTPIFLLTWGNPNDQRFCLYISVHNCNQVGLHKKECVVDHIDQQLPSAYDFQSIRGINADVLAKVPPLFLKDGALMLTLCLIRKYAWQIYRHSKVLEYNKTWLSTINILDLPIMPSIPTDAEIWW